MNSILNSPDVLAALQKRKHLTGKKLEASRQRIVKTAGFLVSPQPQASSRIQNINRFVSNGLVIYKGIRICVGVLSSLHFLFGRRRRK